VLVNALYLKAKWQEQFDRASTRPGAFFASPGRQVQARFMTRAPFQARYLTSRGYQAVELPYRQSDLSMVIIVPASGQLADFERTLTPSVLKTIVANLTDTRIDLHLPRFRFTTKTDLAPALRAMGMRDAFSDAADFSAITRPQMLRIFRVEHQAYLSADEQGTEAAAATAVTAIATAAPSAPAVSLTINRPFVFAVRDRRSGLILFLGRVDDPSAG
jgi:serpin B